MRRVWIFCVLEGLLVAAALPASSTPITYIAGGTLRLVQGADILRADGARYTVTVKADTNSSPFSVQTDNTTFASARFAPSSYVVGITNRPGGAPDATINRPLSGGSGSALLIATNDWTGGSDSLELAGTNLAVPFEGVPIVFTPGFEIGGSDLFTYTGVPSLPSAIPEDPSRQTGVVGDLSAGVACCTQSTFYVLDSQFFIVPELSTNLLFALGLLGLATRRCRRALQFERRC